MDNCSIAIESGDAKSVDNPLLYVDNSSSSRVADTALWAQDLFQLGGSSSSTKVTEKNAHLGTLSICLLFCLGVAAGLINGLILMANAALCKLQATFIIMGGSYGIGLLYFLLAMSISVFIAALCCKHGSDDCAGSGLPQFKYILASEMSRASYETLLSFRVFMYKVVGLILSVGGGLSVGSEGPLVLIAACIAHLLMKHIIYFDDILDNSSLTKQILAASAAVGLGSAFNAPVGGLLFSIEVTSTFYLVSNYWKSFLAAMAGSVACSLFLITKDGANGDPLLVVEMLNFPKLQYWKWELGIFLLMGISFGYLAHGYLNLHQRVSMFMKKYNRDHPLLTAVCVAFITAFFVYITGAYTKDSVGVIALVSDVFNGGHVTEMSSTGMQPMGGLFIMILVRVFLTLLGTNILVPAGIFMPVILMGGILGRFVGYFIFYCGHKDAFIPGYALVGAVAFSSGITHTISAAVIAVEMTGNLGMLLPCLIVAVVSAGITKSKGLSVYDQGMINKGLETFQLLLLGRHGNNRVAASVMDPQVASLNKKVRVLQLIKALELTAQTVYPVTEDIGERKMKLVGSVLRKDIFSFLKRLFEHHGMQEVVTVLLGADSKEHDKMIKRRLKKEALQQRDSRLMHSFTTSIENTVEQITHSIEKRFMPSSTSNSPVPSSSPVPPSMYDSPDYSDTQSSVNPMHNNNNNSSSSSISNTGTNLSAQESIAAKVERGPSDPWGARSSRVKFNEKESFDSVPAHESSEREGSASPGSNMEVESYLFPPVQRPPGAGPGSSDMGMSAAYVWSNVNTAAQYFVKGTMDALQPQEQATEGSSQKRRDPVEEDNPKLLALFSLEVCLDTEPSFHINLFPFR
jgi:H+/Cl- antiporter ClcA